MTRLAQTIISLVERKAFTAKVVRPELVCEMIARSLVTHYLSTPPTSSIIPLMPESDMGATPVKGETGKLKYFDVPCSRNSRPTMMRKILSAVMTALISARAAR